MDTATNRGKGWRYFLPDSASTGWAFITLLLGFAGAFFFSSSEFQHIDESFFAARPFYWAMCGVIFFGLVLVRVLLSFFKPFTFSPPDQNKIVFIIFHISLLLASLIFSFGLTPYLNRMLDKAEPRLVKLTVADKFIMELGTKGFYPEPYALFFIGFDAPKELKPWGLVLVDEQKRKKSPLYDTFYPGQSFVIKGHPGKFGLPWFDFKHQPQLMKYVHNVSLGTDLQHMIYGKTTIAKEALRRNVLEVQGFFAENSKNKEILEKWNVPVKPTLR